MTHRARQETPRSSRSAFSLIELLVVVSIMSLLVALLLPALGSAKAAGVRAMCISRMRQNTMALTLYTSDHAGYFPAYPDPLAGTPNHIQNQYGTWIPPLMPYLNLRPPINPGTGQPITGSDVSHYYPINAPLRDQAFEAMYCPSEVYGYYQIASATYRHSYFAVQNGLRRHYGSPKEPLGGPYVPWKLTELPNAGATWAFVDSGYYTSVTGVGNIRTYGFTIHLPADGLTRSSPQHDGYGVSFSRLDGSTSFVHAEQQYVPPADAPWEFGSAWAPHWTTSGGGKWAPPSGLNYPTQ